MYLNESEEIRIFLEDKGKTFSECVFAKGFEARKGLFK